MIKYCLKFGVDILVQHSKRTPISVFFFFLAFKVFGGRLKPGTCFLRDGLAVLEMFGSFGVLFQWRFFDLLNVTPCISKDIVIRCQVAPDL